MVSPMRWGALRSVAVRTATAPASSSATDRLAAVPRLVAAVARGDYLGTSKGRLLLMAAALLYVVSPADLVPEGILPLIGLGDDAMVTAWLALTLAREADGFLVWERGSGRSASRD